MDWKSIYVMQGSNGDVKIGVSQNVAQRKKTLESVHGINIKKVYSTPFCANCFEIEAIMHNKFKSERIHGEWFSCNYDKAICELKHLFNDIAILEYPHAKSGLVDLIIESGSENISNAEKYVKALEEHIGQLNSLIERKDEQIKELIKIGRHLEKCLYTDFLSPDPEEKALVLPKATVRSADVFITKKEIDGVKKHVIRKGIDVLAGKDSEAYKDSNIRSQVYSGIYNQLKREYGLVSSYKSIKRKYIADVHDFIDCYEPPMVLGEQIKDANNQISMTEI